jgi:aminoglycoside 3-N-acetyltransferase|tara:strand:+ start:1340 stop:2134 length:795 start_codon:yes stop_codon:yes gene_type:complete
MRIRISPNKKEKNSEEWKFASKILESFPGGSNSVLMVHASFSSYSKAGLEANKFCNGLLSILNGGTLLMPTMTWRTVNLKQPVFDEMKTPSHVGILSELFRLNYATNRSLHPTHSVAGIGPLSQVLLGSHQNGTTPCASNSPYGLMREYDAYALFLGNLGLEVCTAIHHCEEVMAPNIYVLPHSKCERYLLRDRKGTALEVETRRHKKLERDFNKFEQELETLGGLIHGDTNSLNWMLVSLNYLYRLVFEKLSLNVKATLKGEN